MDNFLGCLVVHDALKSPIALCRKLHSLWKIIKCIGLSMFSLHELVEEVAENCPEKEVVDRLIQGLEHCH